MTQDQAFPGPPAHADEVSTLLGALERQRATFAWKCSGLDERGLRATVGASTLTLGGLLKHLAFVEVYKFTTMLNGDAPPPPWSEVDWDADPGWPWHSAAADTPAALYALWQDSVERARAGVAAALDRDGLDTRIDEGFGDDPEDALSLRRLLVDVLEEYARHVGHADLIRESVDGSVGEDPPGPVHPYRAPNPVPGAGHC